MTILYVSHLHPPEDAPLENMGGMQRVSMQLVRELRRRGDVRLHTEVLKSSWRNIGLNTFGFLLEELVRLPRLAREKEADVILFSSMVTAALSRLVRGRVEIPMVTINHGQDVTLDHSLYQWFVPSIFESLDGVISVSRATRRASMERGMAPEKGVALPNGVDLRSLMDFPEREGARRNIGELSGAKLDGARLLLSVGRLVRRKGHEWFIREVFPALDPGNIYMIVGDGPEFENVRRAAGESPDGERIFLMGRQPDRVLKMAYAAADLFVMPNIPVEGDMEGFGIVMLEAGMSRTPVVASDLEGIRDVISDGENGYRVPPGEAGRFAETVNALTKGDAEELGNRARTYVREHFGWERVAGKYLEFLDKVIEKGEKGG